MDGIDDDRLATRVDSFYTRARTEDRLAQIFNEAISDWLERLKKMPPLAHRFC
jgi:truncated hemoglobin YjbI